MVDPLEGKADDAPAAPWTRYWASGALHSCTGSFDDGYGGAIGAWWEARFTALGAGDRILDIGTGGGPLPLMLVRRAEGDAARMPYVTAVDLAQLRFGWIPDPAPDWGSKLELRTGVRAEALPFGPATFDLVCSQFGIEYAGRPAAIEEVLRVLRADGRAAFVLHADGSVLTRVAAEEAGHLRWLLEDGDWSRAVEAMLGPMSRSGTPEGRSRLATDTSASAARQTFNAAVRELQVRAAASQVPDALVDARDAVFGMFQLAAAQGLEPAQRAHVAWRQALNDALVRQRGLLDAALDESVVRAIADVFRGSGRDVRVDALRHVDGALLAWGLRAGPDVA